MKMWQEKTNEKNQTTKRKKKKGEIKDKTRMKKRSKIERTKREEGK